MTGARRARWGTAGTSAVALLCAALSACWLAVGAVVAVAARQHGGPDRLVAAAAGGSSWARGLLAGLPNSEPATQLAPDYALSLLAFAAGAVLLLARRRDRTIRLMGLAAVAAAGAFNLQAATATPVLGVVTGLPPLAGAIPLALAAVAVAAYVLALLHSSPWSPWAAPREPRRLLAAVAATAAPVALAVAPLALSLRAVLLLGAVVPGIGLVTATATVRSAGTEQQRVLARRLLSVLVATAAVSAVLAVITALLWPLGRTGLVLADPTTDPWTVQGIALLFWFARLSCAGVAVAALVATRRTAQWANERVFSRGMATALVAAVVGGGYVVVGTLVSGVAGGTAGTVVATVVAAVAFLPTFVAAERVADRLLYGARPAPYGVLAGLAALAPPSTRDAPDLARIVEAVGRGLGAATCRLTVHRVGLRDRTYGWTRPGEQEAGELVEVCIEHGGEEVGTLAVDPAAIAGLHGQRTELLEAIAGSLGVVLQAARSGIELERQLRAALAHAEEIAAARRRVVAETDAERRRIERDLHDGVQHHLVSVSLALGLAEHLVATGRPDEARTHLAQVAEQLDTAEALLTRTTTGMSTLMLADRGLVAALQEELAGGFPPVELDAAGAPAGLLGRSEAEVAVWFCCLEAVNNARKHAPGAAVRVRLALDGRRLRFAVEDDGPGFDAADRPPSAGRGMRNVATRIAAVGGQVDVRSRPGEGTTVAGNVPLPEDALPVPPPRAPAEDRPDRPAAAARPDRPAAAALPVRTTGAALPVRTTGAALPDRLRAAVRLAGELYRPTPQARAVAALAERLEGPLRIAVCALPGHGASDGDVAAVRDALREVSAAPGVSVAAGALPAPGALAADAYVLVLGGDGDRAVPPDGIPEGTLPAPSQAIAVLAVTTPAHRDRGGRTHAPVAAPSPGVPCQVVLRVDAALARAAALLAADDHRALAASSAGDGPPDDGNGGRGADVVLPAAGPATVPAGTPRVAAGSAPTTRLRLRAPAPPVADARPAVDRLRERLGSDGVRHGLALIRAGRGETAEELAAALRVDSGLDELLRCVDARFVARAEVLRTRAVLQALESLLHRAPPPGDRGPLLYELERLRSGAHELAELDLLDALCGGRLRLAAGERRAAERLLGCEGPGTAARLGCPAGSGPEELAQAAERQLAEWRRAAAHPASTAATRAVAHVLVRTCERLAQEAAAEA